MGAGRGDRLVEEMLGVAIVACVDGQAAGLAVAPWRVTVRPKRTIVPHPAAPAARSANGDPRSRSRESPENRYSAPPSRRPPPVFPSLTDHRSAVRRFSVLFVEPFQPHDLLWPNQFRSGALGERETPLEVPLMEHYLLASIAQLLGRVRSQGFKNR